MDVSFIGYIGKVVWGKYRQSGQIAISLVEEDGCPLATATCSIEGAELEWGEVIVKDWSENRGMVEALVKAGVVHPAHRQIQSAFVTGKVCRLTQAAIADLCVDTEDEVA